MKLQTVTDRDGEVYEVKTTKEGNVMLCGEWVCLEMDLRHYMASLSSGRFTVC